MKRKRSLEFIALVIALVVSFWPCSALAGDLENQLKTRYEGKVLTLRQFYEGKKLQFDVNGHLIGQAPTGPWTVDGQFELEELRQEVQTLYLRGRRLRFIFERGTVQPRDVIGMPTVELNTRFPKVGDKGWRKFTKDAELEVELNLSSTSKDEMDVVSAMNAVFLSPNEDIAVLVPEFWKDFLVQQEGASPSGRSSDSGSIFKVGGNVSAPHASYHPDPEYSKEARQVEYQATTALRLTVTPEGTVQDVKISRPVGLGLDEKAVQAVSRWRFDPARKDGVPVPVQINIEIYFRLY